MARNLNGGTDEFHFVNPGAAPGIGAVAFWMKTTQTTTNTCLLSMWTSASRLGWGLLLNNTANKITAAGYTVSANRLLLASATSINDGNPHHIVFNINRNSGGNCQIWIDGASDANANSSGDWVHATPNLWLQAGDNLDTFWASPVADIWELAHWSGAQLTAEEIGALAKGFSPSLIRPDILDVYAPLVNDVADRVGGWAATVTGGSAVPHGRVVGGAI